MCTEEPSRACTAHMHAQLTYMHNSHACTAHMLRSSHACTAYMHAQLTCCRVYINVQCTSRGLDRVQHLLGERGVELHVLELQLIHRLGPCCCCNGLAVAVWQVESFCPHQLLERSAQVRILSWHFPDSNNNRHAWQSLMRCINGTCYRWLMLAYPFGVSAVSASVTTSADHLVDGLQRWFDTHQYRAAQRIARALLQEHDDH